MVLQVAEEAVPRQPGGGPSVRAAAEGGVAAVIDKGLLEGLGEISERAEIRVVAIPLPSQHGVQGMVEVIAPLRVEAIPPDFRGPHNAGIVQVTLRDEDQVAPEVRGEGVHLGRELFEEVHG